MPTNELTVSYVESLLDEFDQLIASFREMSEQLKQNTAKLTEREIYRDTLIDTIKAQQYSSTTETPLSA